MTKVKLKDFNLNELRTKGSWALIKSKEVSRIVQLTQAEYDALTPDSKTLYILESAGYTIKDYNFTIVDGTTPAVDLLSSKSGIADWTSTQTASAPVFSNLPTKGVRNFTIKKTNATDLVITFSLANTEFRFFDSTNKCFTIGTNCTLVSAIADTTFELSLGFTGLVNSSGHPIIHVAGTYNAFA